ncbi:hypothetical protein, partial [Dyadobacter tibetensis]|uniref:hypothetical protein n=1 Tax=Dyadobacter tibetensis TaxID=1211851 RepID=UPI0005C71B4D
MVISVGLNGPGAGSRLQDEYKQIANTGIDPPVEPSGSLLIYRTGIRIRNWPSHKPLFLYLYIGAYI